MDGDTKDEREWFEDPVHERTTIRDLFEKKNQMNRRVRREVDGRKKLRNKVDYDVSTGNECEFTESPKPSDGDKRVARKAVELVLINEESSEDTDKYEVDGSSCAGCRSSADAREKLSCAMGAKRAETRPDAGNRTLRAIDKKKTKTCADVHKSKAGGVDFPKPRFRKMETRSAANEGMEWSERTG